MNESGQDPQHVATLLISDERMINVCATHDVRSVLHLLDDRGLLLNSLAQVTSISAARMHD